MLNISFLFVYVRIALQIGRQGIMHNIHTVLPPSLSFKCCFHFRLNLYLSHIMPSRREFTSVELSLQCPIIRKKFKVNIFKKTNAKICWNFYKILVQHIIYRMNQDMILYRFYTVLEVAHGFAHVISWHPPKWMSFRKKKFETYS